MSGLVQPARGIGDSHGVKLFTALYFRVHKVNPLFRFNSSCSRIVRLDHAHDTSRRIAQYSAGTAKVCYFPKIRRVADFDWADTFHVNADVFQRDSPTKRPACSGPWVMVTAVVLLQRDYKGFGFGQRFALMLDSLTSLRGGL